ncbi:multicopper oxidase family protein [Tropicibacter sp. Alg240-R139]|uniref:multicopper oxidase family protein n=1 Tax=Tropicibacter sp. Alg240-R139 TaxID=2305991 RepID=UPI0013E08EED|nr:multicopper oxidase family protein [Tropicibacter sp. Alg240-R139]
MTEHTPNGFTRRGFLTSSAMAALLPVGANASVPTLTARLGQIRLLPDEYPETPIWGFDGQVPGPLIRLPQGQRMTRKLLNQLPTPTSVHWHGVRVPNVMDGVPGMTQDAVQTGGDFTYTFTPPDAGTFWYHSHHQSSEQVARGLYGVLIVDETEPPDVDHDLTVVLDDWRLTQEGAISDDFDRPHDWTHAGRLGNFIHAVTSPQVTSVARNARLRLRLINVATDRIMEISLIGLEGKIVAFDGMPLLKPQKPERLFLGPAQRVDLIVDVTADEGEDALIASHERDGVFAIAEFSVSGSNTRRGIIPALPDNPHHRLASVTDARKVPLRMEGGAMGGLRDATFKGQHLSIQEMVQLGQAWAFNGVVGMPDDPLLSASTGETLMIEMVNDTAFAHAMHLHGQHFQEVLDDGSFGPLRDTLLMARAETRTIAFRADTPGKWLLHCHMLSHAAAGMRTWLHVT